MQPAKQNALREKPSGGRPPLTQAWVPCNCEFS